MMDVLKGIAASPGIALGTIFRYERVQFSVDTSPPTQVDKEISAIEAAIESARTELSTMATTMETQGRADDAQILYIQLEFLEDPSFGDEIVSKVKDGSTRAVHAVTLVRDELVEEFSQIEDEYFRDRMTDIKDLAHRLLGILTGQRGLSLDTIDEPCIILADDLTPSDTVLLNPEKALALCTELGSATSHTAILSRSLGIPAVVGVGKTSLSTGTQIILDALTGKVLVDPSDQTIEEYRELQSQYLERKERLLETAHEPAVTKDGKEIEIAANIGTLSDARQAVANGADGVGLLRTEFLFLERKDLPSEEEQYNQYRDIAQTLGTRPLVVRTLDVGGDKQLPMVELPTEQNPFLGQRAIRLAMAHPEKLLYPQLRALLRAAEGKELRIMFPMVSKVQEFLALRSIVNTLIEDLQKAGIPHNPKPQVGIMIEIPSAAVTADLFAPHVDFFSIGTNDLTQYVLAVDRTNETIASLADYFDPAVIRLIDQVIRAGHSQGKWVGMCGEMAGDSLALPILLALGLDEFSMAPISVPDIKDRVRNSNYGELTRQRGDVLAAESAEELRSFAHHLNKSMGIVV